MRCLFCGKTLPLLKKLQKREFCSKAHRQQHNRLALARLTEPKHEPELPAADFVACARLAIGSVHPEPVEPHGDTPTAGFAAEVVRPTRLAPETLAGGGERLTRAAVLLPALQATSTRPVPTSAPWLPDPAIPLPGSMSLRGPAVWRGQPGATTLFADLGEPEAGPGQHGFRLPTAAAEPRDIPAREQLSSYKDWGVRVATQRLRFQPLEFVVAPLPAPRSGPRDRVRNRWRSARAPLRVALLTLPLIGAGLAMLPWEKQIFAEKIGPLLRERAAIVLEDDFRSGLSGWGGGSGWAREWQYDLAGFVRPGKLALLNASLALSD